MGSNEEVDLIYIIWVRGIFRKFTYGPAYKLVRDSNTKRLQTNKQTKTNKSRREKVCVHRSGWEIGFKVRYKICLWRDLAT